MSQDAKIKHTDSLLGLALLDDPTRSKGTAFSEDERRRFGLEGLLPHSVETLDRQVERVLEHLEAKPTDLERYIYLIGLCDRNETLFYRTVMSDPARFIPILYDPTVADACLAFGHIYRRARGMYITRHMKGRMAKVLQNWPERDVRFICVSTGGRILGLGDIGANGMGIPIGKLQLYTGCAAVPPSCLLPVLFDIGTTDDALRADPLYLGLREKPPSDQELDELTDEFVEAVQKVFPGCCIHFEDWKGTDAIRMLERYGDKVLCYNDDIKGTASVALAGLTTALQIIDAPLTEQRILFLGAGSAGIGIANLIASAMQMKGLSLETARSRTSMFDIDGLLEPSRNGLSKEQVVYAHKAPPSKDLIETIERFKPTILIGVSTKGGAFNQRVVETRAGSTSGGEGRVLRRAGLHVVQGQGALPCGRAIPGRDAWRQDLPPRSGQQFLHLPGHWAGHLRGTAAAAQRRMLHRRCSGERRPGWPRSPDQGYAVPQPGEYPRDGSDDRNTRCRIHVRSGLGAGRARARCAKLDRGPALQAGL